MDKEKETEAEWLTQIPGYEPPAQQSQPAFDAGTIDEAPKHMEERQQEEAKAAKKAAEAAKKARTWGQFFSEIWNTIKAPFITAVEALIGDKKKKPTTSSQTNEQKTPPPLPKTKAPSAPPIPDNAPQGPAPSFEHPNYSPPPVPKTTGENTRKILKSRETSGNDMGRGAAG